MAAERRESEAVRLLDLAFDAIFTIKAQSHEITYWNAGAVRMYGYSREEAIGRISSELLETRYPESPESAYEAVVGTGQWSGKLIQRRKDGTEVHVDGRWVLDLESGTILEVNREITEHIELAERFQLLVENVKDYAIFLLDPDGMITSWNSGAARINGYSADEVVGRHLSMFYTPEEIAEGRPQRNLAEAAANGQATDEGWRVRKDGSRYFASVVVTAFRDSAGKLRGFAKITQDVTSKQVERQRLLELEQSKSTFLNLVAHELRTPLTVLRGYLSLFRDLDENARRGLEARSLPALEAKTQEMSRLVDQMVEVARLEEGSLRIRTERFDLGTVTEQSVEMTRALDDPIHRIVFEPFAQELNVVGDDDRVRIILGNLLSNAMKFSPTGGDITVTLDRVAGFGQVTVVDQGVGIKLENQIKLFNRYTRFERDDTQHVPGTGMGLYLSRELARRQGGDLRLLWSGPGGSAFALKVPLARA
ncbi:MAG: PAS domain-containing sensor histidine kinase [Chloroflexi bacterium]|nr:MAG: PAS domain-containing sensor histidine kinase [Chloroflexota bacterium]